MLSAKRPTNTNTATARLLSVLPSWMKMKDPGSIGYRVIHATAGSELDLIERTLDLYTKYANITDCPVEAITKLYEVNLEYPLTSGNITPVDSFGNDLGYDVRVITDQLEFFTNPPTRITEITDGMILPSGLDSYITGIEWVNTNPSGFIILQQNTDCIDPSSTLYYSTSTVNNAVNDIPYSGDALGIGYIGLDQNASYEIIQPELYLSLSNQYPMGTWVTGSGDIDNMPDDLPNVYSNYIDPIDGIKKYHYKAFNNPYGSGVYDLSDTKLTFEPLNHDVITMYDILNLTSSGTPYGIPSSGINIYGFISGVWEYRGYDNPIPTAVTPQDIIDEVKFNNGGVFTELVPTYVSNTSWKVLPYSGYIDDEIYPNNGTFDWVDGPGTSGDVIRFSGGISTYQVEYDYRTHSNITQLSADPKDTHTSVSIDNTSIYFSKDSDISRNIPIEQSLSDANAVRINPYIIRPGVNVYTSTVIDSIHTLVWNDAKTTDKTVQYIQHNIGFTDELGGY